MSYYLKDPHSSVDYAFDWSAYLDGQFVATSQWTVAPEEAGGIEAIVQSHDLTRSSARLTGGLVGHVYRVTNRVTLSDGSIDERGIVLRVEER